MATCGRRGIQGIPAFLGVALIALPSLAQGLSAEAREIARLKAMLQEQARQLSRQQQELDSQRRRLDALFPVKEPPVGEPPVGELVSPREAARLRGGQTPPETVGAAPPDAERRLTDLALPEEIGGVLLPRGKVSLEPSVEYAHTSSNRFIFRGVEILPAFLIGVFDITETRRDTLSGALTGRVGITDGLEVELRVPYLYRSDRLRTTVPQAGGEITTVRDIDGYGIGDLEGAIHYQFTRGTGNWPVLVGNLRVKSATGSGPFDVDHNALGQETRLPTGSGFYAVEPSLTVLHQSDPVVFFTNLGYLWNMRRTVDQTIAGRRIGIVDPGDAVRVSFGMGFALNERASFSLGYDHSYILKTMTQLDGVRTHSDSAQVGSLLVGGSYRVNDRVGLNLSVAIGATRDAPDVRVGVRVPVTFSLF